MVSVAKLPPWGDDGWRFSGVMQLVRNGPDWLYAQWPVLDGEAHHGSDRFATMVLRDDNDGRAADIAVMAFALLQVPQWHGLIPWWDPSADRAAMKPRLMEVAETYAGLNKLAVVQTASGVTPEVLEALRGFHFEVVEFAPVAAPTHPG